MDLIAVPTSSSRSRISPIITIRNTQAIKIEWGTSILRRKMCMVDSQPSFYWRINFILRLILQAHPLLHICALIILHISLFTSPLWSMAIPSWTGQPIWATPLWTLRACIVKESMWSYSKPKGQSTTEELTTGQSKEETSLIGQAVSTSRKNSWLPGQLTTICQRFCRNTPRQVRTWMSLIEMAIHQSIWQC